MENFKKGDKVAIHAPDDIFICNGTIIWTVDDGLNRVEALADDVNAVFTMTEHSINSPIFKPILTYAQLQEHNRQLLAANKDCMDHFNMICEDLRVQIERANNLEKALIRIHSLCSNKAVGLEYIVAEICTVLQGH